MITVWRKFYTLARPDGWDFPSGKTINYRDNIGKVINSYRFNIGEEFFGEAFARASRKPDQAWFRIPCSVYEVRGTPVRKDKYDLFPFCPKLLKRSLMNIGLVN